MQPQVVTYLKIPIRNRMYGMNLLAKHLKSLVESKTIQDWHPGRWTDQNHCEIEIGFGSAEDVRFAAPMRGEW